MNNIDRILTVLQSPIRPNESYFIIFLYLTGRTCQGESAGTQWVNVNLHFDQVAVLNQTHLLSLPYFLQEKKRQHADMQLVNLAVWILKIIPCCLNDTHDGQRA